MPVFTPLTRSAKGAPLTHNEMDNNWTGLSTIGIYIGSVVAWMTPNPPADWLLCNGQAVSRTTYSELFSVIGTMYGSGDGSTTFNLPDMRGRFLRGTANGSARDPDRASRTGRGDGTTGDNVGTLQGDQFRSHTHTFQKAPTSNNTGGSYVTPANLGGSNVTTTAAGGSETRPININVNWIMKAL